MAWDIPCMRVLMNGSISTLFTQLIRLKSNDAFIWKWHTHRRTQADRQILSLNISILWVVTLQRWQTQYVLFLRVYFFLLFFFIFFFLWSALRLRSSKFFAHSAWMKQMQHFSGEVCANTFNVSLFCLQEEDKY